MILITDIKIKKYDGDQAQIIKQKYEELYRPMGPEEVSDKMIEIEHIKGGRFVNSNGEEVVIGIDKKSQDLIGLPFDTFEHMQDEINRCRELINEYQKMSKTLTHRIRAFNGLSFFQRVKHILFGGKI